MPSPGGPTTKGDELRLTMPAVGAYARLARVAVAGLATRLGFSYDEVEDLRLAVGEVCSLLVDGAGPDESVTVTYRVEDRALDIEVTVDGDRRDGGGDLGEMAGQILTATVDELEVDEESRRVRLRKTVAEEDDD